MVFTSGLRIGAAGFAPRRGLYGWLARRVWRVDRPARATRIARGADQIAGSACSPVMGIRWCSTRSRWRSRG